MFDMLAKAFSVFSNASTAYDLVKDIKENAEDLVGFFRNVGIYSIHNPDPNNEKVISILSDATGLNYNQVKEKIREEATKKGLIGIGEPRSAPSKKLLQDLKNAGAKIYWSFDPPSIAKGILEGDACLYYGELDNRYHLRATLHDRIEGGF